MNATKAPSVAEIMMLIDEGVEALPVVRRSLETAVSYVVGTFLPTPTNRPSTVQQWTVMLSPPEA